MPDAQFPKDFNLQSVVLTTAAGTQIDLRFVLVEINAYESIWNNHVQAEILIRDANNLISNGPIFGFETILIEFQNPDGALWSKTFRVVGVTNRELENDRTQLYLLNCVTVEAVKNLTVNVSKAYNGMACSDMVSDLFYQWLGGDEIEIEPTAGIFQYIIPNLFPEQAINWLSTRSISASYAGASYLYYEDRDSYRWVTMESRLAAPSVQRYIYQTANVRENNPTKTRDVALDVTAVESYRFQRHSDVLSNLTAGMYGNTVITQDDVTKQWKRYQWTYPETFSQYQHLTSHPLYSASSGDLATPAGRTKVHPTGYDYPFHPEKWLQPRVSQLQQLNNVSVSVVIPGNTNRTVGQVVDFYLPSAEPPQGRLQIYDRYYQGRYLVSALRHKIDMASFVTAMEVVKDSVFTAFP